MLERKFQQLLVLFTQAWAPQASAIIRSIAVTKFMRLAVGEGKRKPTDKGPLRIISRRLARNWSGDSLGSGEEFKTSITNEGSVFEYRYASSNPYAAVHEDGFTGTQSVGAHRRTGPTGEYSVRAYTRSMVIPARPYLRPAVVDDLSALEETAIQRLREAMREVFV